MHIKNKYKQIYKTKFKYSNKTKKYINKTKINNNNTLKGGRYLGEGSYGCVITPAISCKNIKTQNYSKTDKTSKYHKTTNIDKTVSKILITPDKDIKKEISLSRKIHNLDPNQKYFITFKDACILRKIPAGRSDAVSVHHYDDSRENYRLIDKTMKKSLDKRYCPIDLKLKPLNLIMPYGGYDLIDFLSKKSDNPQFLLTRKHIPENFKECFKNLLNGLYKFHQIRIVNRDIKEENITANYNEITKRVDMRFIDFGLSEHLTAEYCSNYRNIYMKGTPDLMSVELIICDYVVDYIDYKDDKQDGKKDGNIEYIFQKIKKFINKTNIKDIYFSIGEKNIYYDMYDSLFDLTKRIYNELQSKKLLFNYFGSQKDKFNGYLQKGDVYALGLALYEFITEYIGEFGSSYNSKFINVNKNIKLHNLLRHMINPNPDKRYNVMECLNHPYFK